MHAPHYDRKQHALEVRIQAARLANGREHPPHRSNGDEQRFRRANGSPSHIGSFTKGLPHNRETGTVRNPEHFQRFITALDSGSSYDIREVPLGPRPRNEGFQSGICTESTDARAWESMAAGNTFDLEGPDAQSITMPPAPELGSDELVTEMTELYWMALCRDIRFTDFKSDENVEAAANSLNKTSWISTSHLHPTTLTDAERGRLRGPFTTATVFRGVTPGDDTGPYISQFMLCGTAGIAKGNAPSDGFVQYGAMRMDQRVRFVEPARNYMTTWESWLDVQDGADLRGLEMYPDEPGFRFITTPRDLATYVHYDALYQAYLNACLIMLSNSVPFDAGIPFQLNDSKDKQQGFATFGGPHILTLVTEVATRALKAIRFQKYNVHRRLRPEAIGGLLERYYCEPDDSLFAGVKHLHEQLDEDLLKLVLEHNGVQNKTYSENEKPRTDDYSPTGSSEETLLLPMAFPEGSPMHPSYGAGHATVAGACVTILKAFFDHGYELDFAFVPNDDGTELIDIVDRLDQKLTVEGELNKVCSNISIGRNWAGVHYFSDYKESILLGEKIALGLLEEQKLTYPENFSMTVPLFDGSVCRI